MALTRAGVESLLIRRCGKLLAAADLDGETGDGSNADLNDAVGYAVRQCGATVDDATLVDDADVARVAGEDVDKLLDVAELRCLETVLGNLDDVNIQVGPRREDLAQLAQHMERRIAAKRVQVQRDYGVGLGTLSAGVITLGFQQHNL